MTVEASSSGKDALYVSAAGLRLWPMVLFQSQLTGMGIGSGGSIRFASGAGVSLLVKLSGLDDTLQVNGVQASDQILIFAGEGNDTLSVGTAGAELSDVDGIVAFFGENGSDDALNVYGNAIPPAEGLANPNQLTAIALMGLGSGSNELIGTHNDVFGAAYTVKDINPTSATVQASDLTTSHLDTFAKQLQATPKRAIDRDIASKLSDPTFKVVFDYKVNQEVVYKVNTGVAVNGLVDGMAYFVSAVDDTSISLVQSLMSRLIRSR